MCEIKNGTIETIDNQIFIFGEIESGALIKFIKALNKCKTYIRTTGKKDKEIEIIINSEGGSFEESLGIINTILNINKRYKVTTNVLGCAYSCASLIFLAGKNRKMSENGSLMFHNLSFSFDESKIEDIITFGKNTKKHFSIIIKNLLKTTNLSEKRFSNRCKNKDWFIFSKQAHKLGITHILY